MGGPWGDPAGPGGDRQALLQDFEIPKAQRLSKKLSPGMG